MFPNLITKNKYNLFITWIVNKKGKKVGFIRKDTLTGNVEYVNYETR